MLYAVNDYCIGMKVVRYALTSETQSALTSTVASKSMLAS